MFLPHEARETRLVKKEFEETAAKAYYPARAISGMLFISFLYIFTTYLNFDFLFHNCKLPFACLCCALTAFEHLLPAFCCDVQDSGKEPANGNEKVIKSEPADSGDMPSLTAVSYSCLLEVDGRDFLVTACLSIICFSILLNCSNPIV